jgi:hypothetical protein
VGFVVDKLALGQIFLRACGFPMFSFHKCSIFIHLSSRDGQLAYYGLQFQETVSLQRNITVIKMRRGEICELNSLNVLLCALLLVESQMFCAMYPLTKFPTFQMTCFMVRLNF